MSCLLSLYLFSSFLVIEVKKLAKHKPNDSDSISHGQFCSILETMSASLQKIADNSPSTDAATAAAESDNWKVLEASAALVMASQLMKSSEVNDMGPLAKSVQRQCKLEDSAIADIVYQFGQGHMRLALTKGNFPTGSTDELHIHSKRAAVHMKCVLDLPGVRLALRYSSRIIWAQCETLLKHYGTSMTAFDEVLESLRRESSIPVTMYICEVHMGRGEIQVKLGEPQKAMSMFKEALAEGDKLTRRQDKEKIAMKVHHKLGSCYRDLKQIDMAVEMYTQALHYSELQSHDIGITTSAAALGAMFESVGHITKAHHFYQKQYEYALRVRDLATITFAEGSLGNCLVLLGDAKHLDKARKYLKEALSRAEELNNPIEVGRAQCNLGNVFYSEKNYAEALKLFRSACQLSIEHHDCPGQQKSCANIGNVYMSLEQPSLARDWYELARNLSPQVSDTTAEADTCYNIGCCYLALHLNEASTPAGQEHLMQAEENFHTAVGLFEQMYSCLGNTSFSELLKLSLFQGYVKAFRQLQFIYCTCQQYEVALELAERSHAMTFNDMARDLRKRTFGASQILQEIVQ